MGSIIYGSTNNAESRAAIQRALELDLIILDKADVYGPFPNERLVGEANASQRQGHRSHQVRL